jgi:hypothetical protein
MADYRPRWTQVLLRSRSAWLGGGSDRHRRPVWRPLRLEALEGRWVPTTLTPTTFLDGGLSSGSLRDAVLQLNADAGTDDDIIQLLPGTYSLTIQNVGSRHETAGLTGDLNLTQTSHRWIIQGAGPSTVIDASQLRDRVFQIVNPGTQVVFQDLVIQGGLAQDNGADGVQAGTTDALGGGVFNNGGDITLDNVVVQNNGARGGDVTALRVSGHNALGGGLYSSGGALTLAGATIANNEATGGRGGDSSWIFYPAGDGGSASGAGLYASGGSLDISESRIANNQATGGRGGDGGFYYSFGCSCYVDTGGGGGAGQGGGLYVNGGSLTLASSTIASNQATPGPGGFFSGPVAFSAGGGLLIGFNAGTVTVSNSTLSGNSAGDGTLGYAGGYGGGIQNSGTLTVTNSTLSGNSAGDGGGIYNNYGTLTVSNSTLSGNSATALAGSGGGIYNYTYATLTVSNSILSGNSAGIFGSGGGIVNTGTLTVTNSTLSGNSAGFGVGGGISNSGSLTVSSSTLSGNSTYYGGGGIFTNGSLTVSNSTLSGNYAYGNYPYLYGGGIYLGLPALLHNTLIAGNFRGPTTRDDVYGSLNPDSDYNLIGDGTGMTGLHNGVNGNLVGSADNPIDPLLGPLADNGGPTLTHALLSGSPAIDAGNNAYATEWDQRGPGFRRIVNGVIDIGAFEVQAHAHSRPTGQPLPDPLPVMGLPLPADRPGFLVSPEVLGPATVPTGSLGIAPNQEVPVGPQAGSMDQGLASLHKEASGPMVARWPAQEPIQAVWLNLELSPEAVGLVR